MMDAAAVLAATELFGQLDDEARRHLAEAARRRMYRKGTFVFLQGDPGDAVFVLLEGRLKVVVTSEQGDEMVLVTLSAPATFGELALVDGRPRSASVEVLEPSTLLMIARSTFLDVLRQHPSLADGLLRSLGTLLRRLTDQAADFVFLDLPGRVAKRLVTTADAQGDQHGPAIELDLGLTQSDLARMVGGSRQSVNQILRSLEEQGYIDVDGKRIVIRRMDVLRRRAGL